MSTNFVGKVVVITGASSRLGEATARPLSAQGASVALGARRVDRLKSLADELIKGWRQSTHGRNRRYQLRSGKPVGRRSRAETRAHRRLDQQRRAIILPQSPLERLKIDDWDRMIDVNIKGVLYGIATGLPYMKQQKAGHIISVSSVAGLKVRPGGVVYSATKHAVRVISEGLRQEVKPYNIRTTVISPGAIATELPNSVTEPDIAEGVKNFYKDLTIPAESFAQAVAYAMSQPEAVDINEILFRPTRQEY
jgi:NADP-dependent 3-hydroxy acid dehydrogenase YdfG